MPGLKLVLIAPKLPARFQGRAVQSLIRQTMAGAVELMAEDLRDEFKAATPVNTGETAKSWKTTKTRIRGRFITADVTIKGSAAWGAIQFEKGATYGGAQPPVRQIVKWLRGKGGLRHPNPPKTPKERLRAAYKIARAIKRRGLPREKGRKKTFTKVAHRNMRDMKEIGMDGIRDIVVALGGAV